MHLSHRVVWRALLAVLVVSLLAPGVAVGQDPAAGSLTPVQQGFELLLDRFVTPLDPRTVLLPAWQAVLAAEGFSETNALLPAPLFNGDREHDWALFEDHWWRLATRPEASTSSAARARAALTAMADAVNEPHTVYLPPDRYAEYLAWARGDVRYAGIGARLSGTDPVVVEVFEDSPAAEAGLQVGDVITHVDHQPTLGRPLSEVVELVRGIEGTPVELTISRGRDGQAEVMILRVVRSQVALPVVRSSMLRGQIGYVLIRGFPEESIIQQVEEWLALLRAEGARGLVLDLRGNNGGRVDVGARLLSLFVGEGPIYQQVPRLGTPTIAYAPPSAERIGLPLAVLVDGGTASMGEIFAAAIQEHGAGVVVGETTAGSVAAAQIYPLADGSALQVTVMEIYSGQGRPLNGIGVTPDVLVENDLEALRQGIDRPLEVALEVLESLQLEPEQLWRWSAGALLPEAA